MFDLVRTSLHRVLTTPAGDGFLPVRLPKDFARRVNVVLGEPICSAAELERRRDGRDRLTKLRADAKAGVVSAVAPQEAAPVILYFEKDRNLRAFDRIKALLESRKIAFTALEVDDATRAFVMREAKCKGDDLPIVFVATAPVGGYSELVEWDTSGKLATAIYGTSPNTTA